MIGGEVWYSGVGGTTIVIGLVVVTIKLSIGESVTLDPDSSCITQEAYSRLL